MSETLKQQTRLAYHQHVVKRCNSIFGHIARMPHTVPAHQALHCQVELSLLTRRGSVFQVAPTSDGWTIFATTTTVHSLTCGETLSDEVTSERRNSPRRLSDNNNDDDDGPAQVTGEVRRRHVVTTAQDKHGQSVVYSLRNPQPVQVTVQMSDMVVLPRVTDKARSCIENGRFSKWPGTPD